MPTRRPRASFEPLSPSLDVDALVQSTPNFEWAVRVHCDTVEDRGQEEFEKLVYHHVIRGGKPLVIEGYETKLDKHTFSAQWLQDHWGSEVVEARDLSNEKNVPMSVQHYLGNMTLLTSQWNERNYKDGNKQRMYLKDIDCPPTWAAKVCKAIPAGLFYLNEDVDRKIHDDSHDVGQSILARAGDLMSTLPTEMRAENLMCYIGHEGTYTPAHREMCASVGHNIMVEASNDGFENGKPTRSGSSLWLMTETKDRNVVSEYWLSSLGHDIEVEKHFAQLNAWKQAPFTVYVVQQKPGDFILIPPLAPHQVWNRGTRTMKVAWNRTTVETLQMALPEALFKARMVCRDEQYKNKAIVYYALKRYSGLLNQAQRMGAFAGRHRIKAHRVLNDFRKLHSLYTSILVSESFSPTEREHDIEMIPFDSNITCSYCRCNIFNRFLTCPSCNEEFSDGSADTYDICLDCYAMGRSCRCISGLRWSEQWSWNVLKDSHEKWRQQILRFNKKHTTRALSEEVTAQGTKRSLAQICQMELRRRPLHDHRTDSDDFEDQQRMAGPNVARENGDTQRKQSEKVSHQGSSNTARCHVHRTPEPQWKQACCSKCSERYCFVALFRAYDEMPQDILANPDWNCPSCREICSCRKCSRKPGFSHYIPRGTLIGPNTRLFADPRSVESLVDFSQTSLAWLKKAGDDHEKLTLRLRWNADEAETEKRRALESENQRGNRNRSPVESESEYIFVPRREDPPCDGLTIDPRLVAISSTPTDSTCTLHDDDVVVDRPEGLLFDKALNPTSGIGGVMRDEEREYESTEAITYEYPGVVSAARRSVQQLTDTQQEHPPISMSVRKDRDDRGAEMGSKRKHTNKLSSRAKKARSMADHPTIFTGRATIKSSVGIGSPVRGLTHATTTTSRADQSLAPSDSGFSNRSKRSSSVNSSSLTPSFKHVRPGPKSPPIRQAVLSDWAVYSSDDDILFSG